MRHKLPREFSFLLGELIGEKVLVKKASSRSLQGKAGTIIDESRNTFLLLSDGKRIRIPKSGTTLYFESKKLAVDGKLLVFRPEDRTKKLSREIG